MNNLLKGKKGIIFGALDEKSIAWKVAEESVANGANIVLTNAPTALRLGSINKLAEKCKSEVIPADVSRVIPAEVSGVNAIPAEVSSVIPAEVSTCPSCSKRP